MTHTEKSLMALHEAASRDYAARDIPTGELYRGIAEQNWQRSNTALRLAIREVLAERDELKVMRPVQHEGISNAAYHAKRAEKAEAELASEQSKSLAFLDAAVLAAERTEKAEADRGKAISELLAMTHRAEKAEAECERLRKDQERYRWLLAALYGEAIPVGEAYISLRVVGTCPSPADITSTIDAAIAQEKSK